MKLNTKQVLRKLSLLVIAVTLLNGCATLSQNECVVADWYEIGFGDGVKGQPESYLEKHRKACSKHGVSTDFSQWMNGREAGLQRYCTEKNGYDEGLNNRTYQGVCVGGAGVAFERAYQHGNELYQQRQLVQDLDKDLNKNLNTRKKLDDKWSELSGQLVNNNLNRDQRTVVVRQMEEIKEELSNMAADHQFLLERYEEASAQLSRMEFIHQREGRLRN